MVEALLKYVEDLQVTSWLPMMAQWVAKLSKLLHGFVSRETKNYRRCGDVRQASRLVVGNSSQTETHEPNNEFQYTVNACQYWLFG